MLRSFLGPRSSSSAWLGACCIFGRLSGPATSAGPAWSPPISSGEYANALHLPGHSDYRVSGS
eukprot:15289791-Alexandrium_andersonii.AAC.1